MPNTKLKKKLQLWVLLVSLVIMTACWDMPGCIQREFPAIRDPSTYVLEVYQVEVREQVGRRNPDIADVIGTRRTKLLARFPVLKLDVGGGAVTQTDTGQGPAHIQAELGTLQHNYAELSIETRLGPPGAAEASPFRFSYDQWPVDTWGTSDPLVNPGKGTLQVLVFRLNSPGGDSK